MATTASYGSEEAAMRAYLAWIGTPGWIPSI